MEGKQQKLTYKRRILPISLFFVPCEDDKGNRWFEISLNGEGYPSIKDTEKCLSLLSWFLSDIKKKGQKELDRINKEIAEEHIKEMMNWGKSSNKNKRQKENGYIYVLKSNGLYKIGKAKNIPVRMKSYETQNPFGIEIIFQKEVANYSQVEKKLLEKFAGKRVRGEWFELTPSNLLWIKQSI